MRSSFNTYGSVAVWFNKDINPGIFNEGENYIWKSFELSGKECSIISEGNKISAVFELGSNKEETVISAKINSGIPLNLHTIILKWANNVINLYMDNEHLKEVKVLSI
ncbi:MAG: hypothetical protein KAS62_02530 [Candidatus Delongbacteria bacterium]|nr:hypothetical protein [Candidatus Delongbacteria bacterium]